MPAHMRRPAREGRVRRHPNAERRGFKIELHPGPRRFAAAAGRVDIVEQCLVGDRVGGKREGRRRVEQQAPRIELAGADMVAVPSHRQVRGKARDQFVDARADRIDRRGRRGLRVDQRCPGAAVEARPAAHAERDDFIVAIDLAIDLQACRHRRGLAGAEQVGHRWREIDRDRAVHADGSERCKGGIIQLRRRQKVEFGNRIRPRRIIGARRQRRGKVDRLAASRGDRLPAGDRQGGDARPGHIRLIAPVPAMADMDVGEEPGRLDPEIERDAAGIGIRMDLLQLEAPAQPEIDPPHPDPEGRLDRQLEAARLPIARKAAKAKRSLEQEAQFDLACDPAATLACEHEADRVHRRVAIIIVVAEADPEEQLEPLQLHLELQPGNRRPRYDPGRSCAANC